MAASDEIGSLARAFSGIGVDEKTMISILGRLHPNERQSFRKGSRDLFVEDERQFERWNDRHILRLQHEFLRLKDAIVVWTMHPWERDGRLVKRALEEVPFQADILIEVACSRSSDELLGARRAYHSLTDRSIEEDVAFRIHGPEKKLLVALVSAYRYEGPRVDEEAARAEAKSLSDIHKQLGLQIDNEEVIRILSTRSKLHLQAIHKHYKEITAGNNLDEDVDGYLKQTVECLCTPHKYFAKVLNASLDPSGHEEKKQGLTRITATRADVDMKQIKQEYHDKYGEDLSTKVAQVANGNYRDFILTLINARES
ncbi:annexin D4 [Andrographis paniculata]|uniref:annexin D4 n=1 Tax=Andrographis paniculata TaxID=175694 RepID=UPI0021E8EC04|nr:annexin D4 [Andrographis paniculata]